MERDSLYVGYLKELMTDGQAAIRDWFGTCHNRRLRSAWRPM
jgi:hypothetical protein